MVKGKRLKGKGVVTGARVEIARCRGRTQGGERQGSVKGQKMSVKGKVYEAQVWFKEKER
jgi:hypothetical protein